MEFINFGRPPAFTEYAAEKFLEAFVIVNHKLQEQGRCNQYDVATELKRMFEEANLQKTVIKISTQKKVELCKFLSIEYRLDSEWFYSDTYNQLEIYILSASPLAIVQMKKRIKRYLLQNI